MAASRALCLTALLFATVVAGPALANGPAVVVEVETGRVLHAERATDPWFPASVTKLMTAYVALDQVRQSRARMDQLLTVSERAAALPPSKMAFKPGTEIRLDNALKIIMVKSANDIAATIAENLGGSVEGFAELMNQAAARLGMRESRFSNPHGLPDDWQQTSARDMAILARALLREFPQHEDLFQIGAIQFGRRVMRNHNGLIGRYPGADGMKTGFICASGFNVVASAKRDGRRLITVVLGSPSANERTRTAAELFDRGFMAQAGFGSPTLDALQPSVLQSPPNMRAVICDRRGPMPGEDDGSGTVNASVDSGIPNLLSTNALAFAPGGMPARTTLGPRAPVQPVPVWIGLAPPSEADLAAQAAAEEAEEQARLAKKGKRAVAAKPTAAKPGAAAEPTLAAPAAIIEESKTGRASLSFKPVSASNAKSVPATAEAKPAAATKPETKAAGRAKPDAVGTAAATVEGKTRSQPTAAAAIEAKAKPEINAAASAKSEVKAGSTPKSEQKAEPKAEAKSDSKVKTN